MPTLRLQVLSAVAATALLAGAPALAQSQGAMTQPSAAMPQPSAAMPAQTTATAPAASAAAPAARAQAPAASTGAAANTNATTSSTSQLTPGLTVKDRTGAAIGQIADISTDAKTGQQLATIQMGSETFRLPTEKLGVFNGAANVNLTQADIEAQLHPTRK